MELEAFDIEILQSISYILEQHKEERARKLLNIIIKKVKRWIIKMDTKKLFKIQHDINYCMTRCSYWEKCKFLKTEECYIANYEIGN